MVDVIAANHTGRELELMLSGQKPLAVFYAEVSELPEEILIPECAFAPHVENGLFIRDEYDFESDSFEKLGRSARIKYVLFAKHDQQWRIPAFLLMLRIRYKYRLHSEAMERFECALLGYSEEEADAWCKAHFR